MEARMAELSVGTDNSPPPLADTVLLLERRVRSQQPPPYQQASQSNQARIHPIRQYHRLSDQQPGHRQRERRLSQR